MNNKTLQKLIFIYNADSGFGSTLLGTAHKIFSPGTYKCNLCDITFGAFTENRRWKKFREGTDLSMEFLHKDEFQKRYAPGPGHRFSFPIVLAATANGFEVLVKTQELNALGQAGELIELIEDRTAV